MEIGSSLLKITSRHSNAPEHFMKRPLGQRQPPTLFIPSATLFYKFIYIVSLGCTSWKVVAPGDHHASVSVGRGVRPCQRALCRTWCPPSARLHPAPQWLYLSACRPIATPHNRERVKAIESRVDNAAFCSTEHRCHIVTIFSDRCCEVHSILLTAGVQHLAI